MTAPAEQQIHSLLKRDGAVLLRTGKHCVYRLSNRQKFTMFKTPSDWRCRSNELSDLRKLLGVIREPRKKSTAPKHIKQGRQSTAFEGFQATTTEHIDQQTKSNLIALGSAVQHDKPERQTHTERKERSVCYTYPREVLDQATNIFNEQGNNAMDAFLAQHRKQVLGVRKSRKQEQEMPSILEMRVTASRELKITLEKRITDNETRVTEARSVIATAEQDTIAAQEQLRKVSDFLSTYDIVINEGETIEPLLAARQQLVIAEARQQAAKPKHTTRITNPLSPSRLLQSCAALFDRDDRVNSQDIIDFLQREYNIIVHPGKERSHVSNSLCYGVQSGRLERVPGHPGEYRKPRTNGHAPVAEAQLAAGA